MADDRVTTYTELLNAQIQVHNLLELLKKLLNVVDAENVTETQKLADISQIVTITLQDYGELGNT